VIKLDKTKGKVVLKDIYLKSGFREELTMFRRFYSEIIFKQKYPHIPLVNQLGKEAISELISLFRKRLPNEFEFFSGYTQSAFNLELSIAIKYLEWMIEDIEKNRDNYFENYLYNPVSKCKLIENARNSPNWNTSLNLTLCKGDCDVCPYYKLNHKYPLEIIASCPKCKKRITVLYQNLDLDYNTFAIKKDCEHCNFKIDLFYDQKDIMNIINRRE